jgi:hypothetical protein
MIFFSILKTSSEGTTLTLEYSVTPSIYPRHSGHDFQQEISNFLGVENKGRTIESIQRYKPLEV